MLAAARAHRAGAPPALSAGRAERYADARTPRCAAPWWQRAAMRGAAGAAGRRRDERRPLLLGIDEGTTAVKAALFDLRASAGGRGAPGGRACDIPRPGWVEQDAEADARGGARSRRRGARASRRARGPRCGPRSPGRVGAGLGGGHRAGAHTDVVWQDKRQRGAARGDRPGRDGALGTAARPLLLGGQAGLAARARRRRGARARGGPAAPGHRRRLLSPSGSAGASRRTSRRPRGRSCWRSAGATGTSGCWPPSACGASGCRRSGRRSGRWASCAASAGRCRCPWRRGWSTSRRRWPARGRCVRES